MTEENKTKYVVTGTTYDGEYETEDEIEHLRCQYCNTHILNVDELKEDAYGEMFCMDESCVWQMAQNCYHVSIEVVE